MSGMHKYQTISFRIPPERGKKSKQRFWQADFLRKIILSVPAIITGCAWPAKKERAKEVAELEQTISGSKEELSFILHQQIAAGQETEQIRKEGETIRQEVSELLLQIFF